MGIGMAISLEENKVFVILGDGEINEGSVRE
jgi:transketolase N-terminal domain/subunit